MTILIKDGETKNLSNEGLIELLISQGWEEKKADPAKKKEVKDDKSSSTTTDK